MKHTTFKQFLEGENPENKFIKMMNQILGDIPELKRQQAEFDKKIKDAVASVPNLFKRQEELEAWMRAAVKAVNQIPNKMLGPFLHELGDLEKEYREGTSILDMLSFVMPHSFQHQNWKRDRNSKRFSRQQIIDHEGNLERMIHNPNEDEKFIPIVVKFIQNHADDIEDAIKAVDHGYDAIRDMANKEKWPAAWQRYGALPSDRHAFKHTMEDLIYWIKELKK